VPKRTDIHKILILGSGPIVISQACEFDYSGAQACKTLRSEGFEIVLANSNPATIMTDPVMADRTYVEPLVPDVIESIIAREKPDAVVVAAGSVPKEKPFPGDYAFPDVVNTQQVLKGEVETGKKVLLVDLDAHHQATGTAEFLADPGDCLYTGGRTAVTIVELLDDIAMDVAVEERMLLLQRLRAKEVRIITSAKVKEILDDGVVIVRGGQEEAIRGMDRVILAMGTRPIDELSSSIKDKVAEVYVIGDAKEPRKALEAIHEGAEVGRKI